MSNISKSTAKRSTNLLVLISLTVLVVMLNTAFTEFSPKILVLLIGCLLSLVGVLLNRIQWSSIILITSGWITLTWFIGTIGGITNVNMIYYFFIVLMSVFLLPKNYWLIVLTITIATISLLAIAQTNQLIEIQSSKSSNYYVLTNHLIQIIASIGTFVYTREMWLKREHDLEKSRLLILRKTAALAAANKTLSISETRFRDLVEHAPEAIILYDVKNEKIVEANSKASQLIGMSKSELLKSTPLKLLGDESKSDETLHDILSQILTGELITFKQIIRHADGHHIPISVQAIQLPDEENPLLRVSVSDLTEVVKKEAKIQHQTTLLDQVSEAIISIDVNHHITSWNPAAEKIYGWKSSEVMGKFITDLIPTNVINHSPYAIEKEDDYRIEVLQPRKDGSTVHVSSSISPYLDLEGNLIGTVVASRNISKRYKVQQDLKETTDRLDNLINNIPILVGHADKKGSIVFLNDFHKSFGLNPADLIGIVYTDLFSPDEQAILEPQVEKALAGERTEFEMFINILDIKYFMEIVIIPHKIDHSTVGFYVMAIDRTERLKAFEA